MVSGVRMCQGGGGMISVLGARSHFESCPDSKSNRLDCFSFLSKNFRVTKIHLYSWLAAFVLFFIKNPGYR